MKSYVIDAVSKRVSKVLRMRQGAGERMAIFRTAEGARNVVTELRRAQAEAEIRCF